MCSFRRDRPQIRHAAARDAHAGHEWTPAGPTERRVGVHAGQGRPERRSDRHEQQQHIADTPCESGGREQRWTAPDVSRGRRAVRSATGVRPLGHGPVRGHPRVEETVAGPAAAGGRRCRATDAVTSAGDRCRFCAHAAGDRCGAANDPGGQRYRRRDGTTATHARTPVGPDVQAARRPVGPVRLQTAAVADKHGRWPANATVGRGPATAAGATGDREGRAGDGRGRQTGVLVVEVERALLDNTGRLSRGRGLLSLRRRSRGRPQIRLARQPHAQRFQRRRRSRHLFRSGNGPLTGALHVVASFAALARRDQTLFSLWCALPR